MFEAACIVFEAPLPPVIHIPGRYNVRDYLSKPTRPDRLHAKISKFLG